MNCSRDCFNCRHSMTCTRNCFNCRHASFRTDDKGYIYGIACMKYKDCLDATQARGEKFFCVFKPSSSRREVHY